MKKYYTFIILICFKLAAQVSPDQNYILATTPTSEVTIPNFNTGSYSKLQEVSYFDGLGRNIQNTKIAVTPESKDLVQPVEYDQFGRKIKDYLSFPTSAAYNGAFIATPMPSIYSYYINKFPEEVENGSVNPYSETAPERSPLQRSQEAAAPGKDWKISQYGNVSAVPIYNYSWSYNTFVTGYVAGGSPVTLSVNAQGLMNVIFNFGGPNFKFLTGNVQYVGNLPDTTLGYIKDMSGVNTSYLLSIKNGYLFISSALMETLTSAGTTFTYQFGLTYSRTTNSNTVKNEYKSNIASSVRKYSAILAADRKPTLRYDEYYASNALTVNVTRNENWKGIYHAEWDYHDFLTASASASSGQNIVVDISPSNILSLTVNISLYPWSSMKTGAVKTLPFQISNVNLGYLTYNGANVYSVAITNNTLYIQNVFTGSGLQGVAFNTKLTTNVTLGIPPSSLDNTVEEYYDKYKRLVLTRKFNNALPHDTYNVYDQNNNLAFVIPPKADDLIGNTAGLSTDLTSAVTVTSVSGPLNLKASNSITLKEGFHAVAGSTFSAVIDNGTQNILDDLCYQYRYDHRNRVVEKKLPGKELQSIVYDKLNRPLLSQDPIQKSQNIWIFTKYDKYNRITYTGIYNDSRERSVIQAEQDAVFDPVLFESKTTAFFFNSGTNVYYTNAVFPTTGQLLTVHYYDDYVFDKAGMTVPAATSYDSLRTSVKGEVTGELIRTLNSTFWTTTLFGYDSKGRNIWSRSKNIYLGSEDNFESKLNFIGQKIQNKTDHLKTGLPVLTIYDYYTYDNASQLIKHSQKIGSNSEQLIFYNKYNELGQIIQKKVGGSSTAGTTYDNTPGLQTVDYSYNIRGWVKSINDTAQDLNATGATDLFAYKINYNNYTATATAGYQAIPLYNGNIADITWKSKTDNRSRIYAYKYDALDRMTDSNLFINDNPGPDLVFNYKEGPVTYDKNSNILSLERSGLRSNSTLDKIDILSYIYQSSSNNLSKVIDTSDSAGFNNGSTAANVDYAYDTSGNLIKDLNKNIGTATTNGIFYNSAVNLPETIITGTGNIQYVYDAKGTKLSKKMTVGSTIITTQYNSGFIYEQLGSGTNNLQFFSTPEGYARKDGLGNFSYVFQYKDHLGNIRLSYTDVNSNGSIAANEIIEENNYYPFGLEHKGYNSTNLPLGNIKAQKYKYNSKEFQDELSVNVYDYGARNYEPSIGRWINIDLLAEKYSNYSPYSYVANNPVIFKDPDGRDIVYFDINGVEITSKRVSSTTIFETHIAKNDRQTSFSQVPMPNIIQKRVQSGDDTTGSSYQENDYIIAARTGLFNQTKNSGLLKLYTEGGNLIPQEAIDNIPDLDPTLVKAVAIQESNNGTTGITDIMTANNPGDYKPYKEAYGLIKSETLDVNRSLYLGIRFLATKGFRGGISGGTFTFKGWERAAGNYNGWGVENSMEIKIKDRKTPSYYEQYIKTMIDDSQKATPSDF